MPLLPADGWRRRSRAVVTTGFVLVSLALHAGAGAALLAAFRPDLSGAVDIATSAVSVEIVAARDLETSIAPKFTETPPAPEKPASEPSPPAQPATLAPPRQITPSAPPPTMRSVEPARASDPPPRPQAPSPEPARPEKSVPDATTTQSASAVAIPTQSPTAEPPAAPSATPVAAEPPAQVTIVEPASSAERAHEPEPARITAPPTVAKSVPAEPGQLVPLPSRRPRPPRITRNGDDNSDEDSARSRPAPSPRKRPSSAPSVASAGSAAKASASRGALIAYRSRVQSHLASRRPAGIGVSGRVVIGFSLTSSGGLGHASVTRSSGNPALDRLALATVRAAAPFPAPPAGSRPGDLRFAFPYTFR